LAKVHQYASRQLNRDSGATSAKNGEAPTLEKGRQASLPGMSGIDLNERLLCANWTVPTIFITAHEDVYARRLVESSMECLTKPFLASG
jgi:hypothetical protein